MYSKKEVDPNEQLDSAVSALHLAIENIKQSRNQEIKVWQQKNYDLQNQVQSLQSQLTESVHLNAQLQNEVQELTAECNRLRAMNQTLHKTLQEKELDISRFNALNESLKSLLEGSSTGKPLYSPLRMQTSQIPQQMQFQQQQQPPQYSDIHYDIPTPSFDTKMQYSYQPQVPQYQPIQPKQNIQQKQQYPDSQYQSYEYKPMQSPTQNYVQSPNSPSTQKDAKKSSKGKSSLFLQLAKEELTYSEFNSLINEINKYNKHKQNKQATISNVQSILCPKHTPLFDQFLPMISGI